MMLYRPLLAIVGWLVYVAGSAQNGNSTAITTPIQQAFSTTIERTAEPITIDGELQEAIWQQREGVSNFWKKFPTDDGPATRQTLVRLAFDDRNLYVAVIAYDSGKSFIQTLKRDGGHDGSDGFAVVIDPTNQHTNGFFFVVNAFNSQSEDQLNASGNGPNFSWDQKWFSATTRHPDRWIAELAIPFKSLRYGAGVSTWGINFIRIDTKTTEYSCWTKVPVNFASWDLGYTGALQWGTPPPAPGSNIVLVPYLTGQGSSVNKAGGQDYDGSLNGGFDAKIGLGSNSNLDLTVNPDFSQIEVDRQVTNLTRFNIFFPERRTFFLENDDLFSSYGIPPIRPFYSRRIGLDNQGNPIPILAGARFTGNLTSSLRLGAMNMQTGNKGDYKTENFTAVTANQRVLKRSVVKGYFLNRQRFLTESEKAQNPKDAYGRNAGIELAFTNVPGTWSGWGAMHKSFKPTVNNNDIFWNAGIAYNDRRFEALIDFVDVGTNYYADMGFIERIENYDAARDTLIRLGFRHMFSELEYRIFPKTGSINTWRLGTEHFVVWNPDGSLNEQSHGFSINGQFKNTSNFTTGADWSNINLIFPISFTGNTPLPAGNYAFWRGFLNYRSDFRKPFSFDGRISTGGFYNGQFTSYRFGVTWRHPPHVSVAMQAEYNRLTFPDPYGSTELFLISPRIDINFTTNVFWTTFLQYNTQANNFNINSRFQWRYRPMSDLFVVYTDNYFTDPLLKNKTRALVFKLNYWLNM